MRKELNIIGGSCGVCGEFSEILMFDAEEVPHPLCRGCASKRFQEIKVSGLDRFTQVRFKKNKKATTQ